jgi:DNA-binding response OmpR family regulator
MQVAHKILLADDDTALTALVGSELSHAGYQVEVCNDGLSAIERILAWRPHLVILDHNMPGLDGRALCSRLRRSFVNVKVVMLTAASAVDDRVAGLDAGADDYVCKPFDMPELVARVRAHLREVPLLPAGAEAEPDSATAGDSGLVIRVLGSFQLLWHGTEVSGLLWNRRQPLLLLKLLIAQYDRPVLSDVLEETIWPELDAERARRSLHVAAQRLRTGLRTLGPNRVQTCPGGYAFRPQPEDDLDLKRFDELASRLTNELSDPASERVPLDELRELSTLYAGELFAEERYADWVVAPRERLHHLMVDLLRRGADRCRQAHASLTRLLLQRLADLEPASEEHTLLLAECLLEQGDREGAHGVLTQLRERLRSDLNVAPSAAFERLWLRTASAAGS